MRADRPTPCRQLLRCRAGGGSVRFTAQFARGHGGLYRYYRCTRKHGLCSERYVQERELKEGIAKKAQAVAVPSEWIPEMLSWIDEEARKETQEALSLASLIDEKLAALSGQARQAP